jgi:hypothetical protein
MLGRRLMTAAGTTMVAGCDRMGQHFIDLTQIELIEKRLKDLINGRETPPERLVEMNDPIQIVICVYRRSNSRCDVRCHSLEVIWIL